MASREFEELLAALQNQQAVAGQADQDILAQLSQPLPQAQQVEAESVRNPLNFGTALGAFLQGPQSSAGRDAIAAQNRVNALNAAAEQRAIEINATYKDRRDQREANRKMERERILAAADARVAQFETKIAEARLGAAERAETRAARNKPKDPAEEAFKRYFEWSKTVDGQEYLLSLKPKFKAGKMHDGEGNRVAIPGTEPSANPEARAAALEVIGDMYDQLYGMVNANRDFWAPDLIARELNELDAAYDDWKKRLVVEGGGGDTDKKKGPPETSDFLGLDPAAQQGLKNLFGGGGPAKPLTGGGTGGILGDVLQQDVKLAVGAIDGALDIPPEPELGPVNLSEGAAEINSALGGAFSGLTRKRTPKVPFVQDGGAQ